MAPINTAANYFGVERYGTHSSTSTLGGEAPTVAASKRLDI
jgi:hypothetical protein